MTPAIPLADTNLNLDISGVAGFFGGDVAVSAMATVHVYPGRKWLGWYNTPGSYEIAKRFGILGKTRFWDGLYPGVNVDPAELFELDGAKGPKYRALRSGTVMKSTGHLAYLFARECKDISRKEWSPPKGARKTSPVNVTIADLEHTPPETCHPRMSKGSTITATSLVALIPILACIATAIPCAIFKDWTCFSMIVFGMLVNGVSCFIIGSGVLTFTHPLPAEGAPPADGILEDGEQIIILRGAEGAVNPITRGRFTLKYACEPNYHPIGISSLLLTVQFIVQLVAVPQGEIFGQIMFLSSLAVSWMYNSYLSSLDKESIQRRLLHREVLQSPRLRKFELPTRTSMTVFVLLVLAARAHKVDRGSLCSVLNDLLPNDTDLWQNWKDRILHEIQNGLPHGPGQLRFDSPPRETNSGADVKDDADLLERLYDDARLALQAFEAVTRSVLASPFPYFRRRSSRHRPQR
ncbi:uncharacterized protein BXZ73DRAFT_37284 [Epithele typhae]|uniref:uncharacterized protein n=1 Tax=Epithele typhae TaxID=378194 RepID=UPI00200893BB|nr:uncharacterized protein BXZ73DRAFT_37284 [Epithele typhae]KAH9946395.1 hypothetical protein BXZ73DRAFT_37284 [Epithele typhae]